MDVFNKLMLINFVINFWFLWLNRFSFILSNIFDKNLFVLNLFSNWFIFKVFFFNYFLSEKIMKRLFKTELKRKDNFSKSYDSSPKINSCYHFILFGSFDFFLNLNFFKLKINQKNNKKKSANLAQEY